MQTTYEALQEGYVPIEAGSWSFKFGDNEEYELVFEHLLFDNQMYVALYKDDGLLTTKVVVKPGKE